MVTDQMQDGLMLIGGTWIEADHDAFKEVVDPATEKEIGRITYGTIEDASQAVEAAAQAFPAWRATPATARAAVLQNVARTIRERTEAIAHIIVRETGKTLGDARGEVRLKPTIFNGLPSKRADRMVNSSVPMHPIADNLSCASRSGSSSRYRHGTSRFRWLAANWLPRSRLGVRRSLGRARKRLFPRLLCLNVLLQRDFRQALQTSFSGPRANWPLISSPIPSCAKSPSRDQRRLGVRSWLWPRKM